MKNAFPFDQAAVLRDLTDGVAHLHSLEIAHIDLNPNNIMMDANGQTVIIDFGSAAFEGRRLKSCGTPGWSRDWVFSSKNHDQYALNLIAKYVGGEYDGYQPVNTDDPINILLQNRKIVLLGTEVFTGSELTIFDF